MNKIKYLICNKVDIGVCKDELIKLLFKVNNNIKLIFVQSCDKYNVLYVSGIDIIEVKECKELINKYLENLVFL